MLVLRQDPLACRAKPPPFGGRVTLGDTVGQRGAFYALLTDSSTAVLPLAHTSRDEPTSEVSGESSMPGSVSRRALEGERAAWEELIARHGRRVVLSLIAHGVLPAQAREFAQDAWMRVMQQASQGRLAYLQLPGLVVRQGLYLARAANRRPEALPQVGEPEDLESPEASYLARERLARARARVDSLAPSARTVFLLLYTEPQLSHAELAARVGLSVQRVRQIICEVRKELRAHLEESDARPRQP